MKSLIFKHPFLFALTTFLAGISLSFFVHEYMFTHSIQTHVLRESSLNKTDTYSYIDPLIAINDDTIANSNTDNNLEHELRSLISSEINKTTISTASILFIDEKDSTGFIINPNEKYSPASLLKVPTLIAYYKLANDNKNILSEKLHYDGAIDHNLQEHILSPIQLQKDAKYTVDELLQHMIKYSDNNAATLLIDHLNEKNHADTFNRLFNDMGIDHISVTDDFITLKTYSLFFRVLYNATYLDREWSEKALQLMTETDFSKGIESGVPHNIPVAQKFGEFTLQNQNGQLLKRELHDCGIIYYPDHPYLLCIMTKGTDFPELESFIANASRKTFEYIESQYPNAHIQR